MSKPVKPSASPKASDSAATTGERIAKVIARSGRASRREAEQLILDGKVTVNGKAIDSPALNVLPRDKVMVDGTPLSAPEPPRLWLYHKPTGLVTTTKDEQGRATIYDDMPPELPRVMSIGRLDLNSEGLLLLTNDGAIKRKLELPSTGWLRRYRVRVKGNPDDARLEPLRKGIEVDGQRFQPMMVSLDRQQASNAWLTVGLREGKNREIRRAMEDIGLSVNRLIRISYGPFQLGELEPGAIQEIRGKVLRDQLGLEVSETPHPAPISSPAKPFRQEGDAKATGKAGKGAKAKTGRRPNALSDPSKRVHRPKMKSGQVRDFEPQDDRGSRKGPAKSAGAGGRDASKGSRPGKPGFGRSEGDGKSFGRGGPGRPGSPSQGGRPSQGGKPSFDRAGKPGGGAGGSRAAGNSGSAGSGAGKAGPGRSGPNKAGPNKSGPGRAAPGKAGQSKAGPGKRSTGPGRKGPPRTRS